METNKAETFV